MVHNLIVCKTTVTLHSIDLYDIFTGISQTYLQDGQGLTVGGIKASTA